MVYVVKTFDPERIKKSPTIGLTGAGGHMGFVVGTHGDTLYIYTAATEPKSQFKVGDHDLHGIQAVPLNPNNHKKIFYFKSTM
jgi:hypothetical protein